MREVRYRGQNSVFDHYRTAGRSRPGSRPTRRSGPRRTTGRAKASKKGGGEKGGNDFRENRDQKSAGEEGCSQEDCTEKTSRHNLIWGHSQAINTRGRGDCAGVGSSNHFFGPTDPICLAECASPGATGTSANDTGAKSRCRANCSSTNCASSGSFGANYSCPGDSCTNNNRSN